MVGGRETAAREDLEVGPQRGERRAQLVRGVRDEAALRALGLVERLEHRVEGTREARELVVAVALHAAGEVARARDVLGRVGEVGDRLDRRAGGEPGERERRAMPSSTITPSPKRSVASVALTSPSGRATCMTAPFGSCVVSTRTSPPARSTSEKNAPRSPSATSWSAFADDERGGLLADGVATLPPGLISCTKATGPSSADAAGTDVRRTRSRTAASSGSRGIASAICVAWRSELSICPRNWSRTST